MKPIFIVFNMDDEPVMAFDNEQDAEIVVKASDGVSNLIRRTVLIEGSEHEGMPAER